MELVCVGFSQDAPHQIMLELHTPDTGDFVAP